MPNHPHRAIREPRAKRASSPAIRHNPAFGITAIMPHAALEEHMRETVPCRWRASWSRSKCFSGISRSKLQSGTWAPSRIWCMRPMTGSNCEWPFSSDQQRFQRPSGIRYQPSDKRSTTSSRERTFSQSSQPGPSGSTVLPYRRSKALARRFLWVNCERCSSNNSMFCIQSSFNRVWQRPQTGHNGLSSGGIAPRIRFRHSCWRRRGSACGPGRGFDRSA
jgi:hypothetical protein